MARRTAEGAELAFQLAGEAPDRFGLSTIDRTDLRSRGRNRFPVRWPDPMLTLNPVCRQRVDVAGCLCRHAMPFDQPRQRLLRRDPAFARHRPGRGREPCRFGFLRLECGCSGPCGFNQRVKACGKLGIDRSGRRGVRDRQARIDRFRRARREAGLLRHRGGRAACGEQDRYQCDAVSHAVDLGCAALRSNLGVRGLRIAVLPPNGPPGTRP